MNRLLLAVGLVCLAGATQAQMRPSMNPDANGDGKVSFAELEAADDNKDGWLSSDELAALRQNRGRGGA